MRNLKSDRQNNRALNKTGLLLKFGNFYYRVRNDFVDKDRLVPNRYTESDQQLDEILSNFPEERLKDQYEIIYPEESKMKKSGGYLNYIYNKAYPEYGVYDKFDITNYQDNCLMHALKLCNLTEEQIQGVRCIMMGHLFVPTSSLKQVSKFLDSKFIVHDYTNKKIQKYTYGTGKLEINLGLIENHYFYYDDKHKEVIKTIKEERKREIYPDEFSRIELINNKDYSAQNPRKDFDYKDVKEDRESKSMKKREEYKQYKMEKLQKKLEKKIKKMQKKMQKKEEERKKKMQKKEEERKYYESRFEEVIRRNNPKKVETYRKKINKQREERKKKMQKKEEERKYYESCSEEVVKRKQKKVETFIPQPIIFSLDFETVADNCKHREFMVVLKDILKES